MKKDSFINQLKKLKKISKEKLNNYIIQSYQSNSSEIISIRLNPIEKKIIEKLAKDKNFNITNFIKYLIIKEYIRNE